LERLKASVGILLSKIGFDKKSFHIEALSAGGNNRVFIVHVGGNRLLLKWYFHDASDLRDRLGIEYAFMQHIWNMGLRCIPQPIGRDADEHIALYEFVEGVKLESKDIGHDHIKQAADFLAQLNSSKSRTLGLDLPIASEACFSVIAHLDMISARLGCLQDISRELEVNLKAVEFINILNEFWSSRRDELLKRAKSISLDLNLDLPANERFLSPSDFGFHNALYRPNGELCFIDFEYAGWDDPAKTIGDFFSHPGVPVKHEYFDGFISKVLTSYPQFSPMLERIRIMEPIFQMKWCCIILNEFLPQQEMRRNFANPDVISQDRKVRQLEKAQKFFEVIKHQRGLNGIH